MRQRKRNLIITVIIVVTLITLIWAYNSGYVKLPSLPSPVSLTCDNELKEQMRIFEAKYPEREQKIIERKSFTTLEEAITYVQKWNADNGRNTINTLKEEFSLNFGRIDVFLVQETGPVCVMGMCDSQSIISTLRFGICKEEKIIVPNM